MSKNSTQFLETQFPLGQLGILLRYTLRFRLFLRSKDWYRWLLRGLLWEKSRFRCLNVNSNPSLTTFLSVYSFK